MLFGKQKKQQELLRQQELEQKRIEKERILMEEKLLREKEAEEARALEEAKKIAPYKFSVPDPYPKELVSVLKIMFKKLFPDVKKAYLVYTQYEDKSGYLLVVDIDAKFLKIINIYLDGETKKVRNGLPIECILYSKSGSLTDGMEPFYQKEVAEVKKPVSSGISLTDNSSQDGLFADMPYLDVNIDIDAAEALFAKKDDDAEAIGELEDESEGVAEPEVEAEVKAEPEDAAEPEIEAEPEVEADAANEAEAEEEDASETKEMPELTLEEPKVKVAPETKQQLFALMNRVASSDSDDVHEIACSGFGEFEFYIPYLADGMKAGDGEIDLECPEGARPVLLINRDNGIKAIAFFTEEESAFDMAKEKECRVLKIKYKDYKNAISDGSIVVPSAEGIIINPQLEQILLPPDYPLL